jgi:hypothetical protein
MSEFDKLKDQAEREIEEHPEQVKAGEQAAGKKLGLVGQGDEKAEREQGGQPQGDAPPDDQADQVRGR